MSRPKLEQQVSVDRGRMTLASGIGPSQVDVATPGRYVPGALLPLVVQELAERPCLVKTESFVFGTRPKTGTVCTVPVPLAA